MPGVIEAYLEARRKFHAVAAEIYDAGFELSRIGEALCEQPSDVAFDADQWKSAQEIQSMLALYRDARAAMNATWEEIAPDLRYGLLPPIGSDDDE